MNMFDTVVIGAGQTGLAAGYYLQTQGSNFVILEKNSVGGSWNDYYESLELFTPAQYSGLPGLSFPKEENTYPTRDEMASYLKMYATHFNLPVETGVQVADVRKEGDVFVLETSRGTYQARSVIVATGPFNEPYIPTIPGTDKFTGTILHTHEYKNPTPFKNKRVVVVGGGASGVQIAVELAEVADVTLALKKPVRFRPRMILGKDLTFWSKYTVDLFKAPSGGSVVIDRRDKKYERALKKNKPPQKSMFTALYADGVVWQEGTKEPVDVVLFATGYQPRFDFLSPLSVVESGALQHRDGVSMNVPGLFFVGQHNQRNYASATVRGAGNDARIIIQKLAQFLKDATVTAAR